MPLSEPEPEASEPEESEPEESEPEASEPEASEPEEPEPEASVASLELIELVPVASFVVVASSSVEVE